MRGKMGRCGLYSKHGTGIHFHRYQHRNDHHGSHKHSCFGPDHEHGHFAHDHGLDFRSGSCGTRQHSHPHHRGYGSGHHVPRHHGGHHRHGHICERFERCWGKGESKSPSPQRHAHCIRRDMCCNKRGSDPQVTGRHCYKNNQDTDNENSKDRAVVVREIVMERLDSRCKSV